jgi:DNA-binding CsgD family transcriptional regulator
VELLERDGALAALTDAHAAAATGEGRVAFVTGEPGIGKTSLVNRFVRSLEPDARVLLGTCDDLSIPRPLGPFRDLVGTVSPALDEAMADGAAPHDIRALLIAELELSPRPTVLVLEDIHWADDATFDSVAVVGRRIGSIPALLVLTFRAGEAPPGHPLHATVGAIRARDSVTLKLAPLSADAVASLAGDGADQVYAATGGNQFYVTEWALTARVPMPTDRFQLVARELRSSHHHGWGATRIAAWAAVAGVDVDFEPPDAPPYAAMYARDWLAAADGFGAIGWSYDRALMLSLLEDEAALVEALDIARTLGAKPLTRRVMGRLRSLGLRVPAGRRETTRANPAGLTARQLDVLKLLVEGLTNAQIAETLVVSPRTAEHHVAAVLTKLGASTRKEAALRAAELR